MTNPPDLDIRVGTSGWNYPKGRGTWNGIFYPAAGQRPRGFKELTFYAEHFNTVEVNSTFYGQPREAVSLQWVKQTPERFEFSLKLYQKFTHPRLSRDATPIAQEDIDLFRAGVEPLAAAGKLGMLLAQFPHSFHDDEPARDYLAWLCRTFADYPLAIELRHPGWSEHRSSVNALLAAGRAAWVQIDEPTATFAPPSSSETAAEEGAIYVRLHGRNKAQWWRHEQSEDRYNYMYSEAELAPVAEAAREARGRIRKAYLYLNNHFSAQAVANAAMLRELLDEPVTTPLPAELIARYPQLERKTRSFP